MKKHNSKIDWKKKVFKFEKCICVNAIQFAHRQSSMTNEKQSRKSFAKKEFATLIKNILTTKIDFTNIDTNQTSHEMRKSEKFHTSFEILENVSTSKETTKHVSHIYKNWKHLFREKTTTTILFKHQSWNHEIKLKSKK